MSRHKAKVTMGHFGKMGLKWLVSSLVISNAHAFYIPGKGPTWCRVQR